ncbi:histidine kinase [Sphaerisporangium sp. TRM90804]|uniref:sensor histidine kinase n=1 Tax=Sphaerisporangium sp. TRM90804 TaxID=3031113 RepID=UPI00244D377E|nr:histidine kinase [Sphaerisporangium sp. TRM90804]MDH2424646.1 histidine kinase [Sphaerisporangium sp. TRM90804]
MSLAEAPVRLPGAVLGRAGRVPLALLLGTVTALAELLHLVAAGLAALVLAPSPRGRRAAARLAHAGARRLAALEVRRLRPLNGVPPLPGRSQALAYVAARWPVGILGGIVLALLVFGAALVVRLLWGWAHGVYLDGIEPTPLIVTYLGATAALLLFLDISGMAGVMALDRALARRLLEPGPTALLERRIAELAESRAGIVTAVDAERRRIERDLHDGVQQRLVALAMLIGRARRGRSPELLDTLLLQAHEEATAAIGDLREVAWRIYPAGLDSLGLRDAVAAVAERAGVPVAVDHGPHGPLPSPVETAAYFVVCEAVTNAAKHAGATRVAVRLARRGATLEVTVRDDGRGGADPGGVGLSGLARRVAALDGRFGVASPPGGPTTVTAELPCA